MVAISDASYIFQSILGNILAYFSFFEKINQIKRVRSFNVHIEAIYNWAASN